MNRLTRRGAFRQGMAATAALIGGKALLSQRATATPAEEAIDRTEWMAGKWGLMVHWIAPGPAPDMGMRIRDLNRAVNAFDAKRFLTQFEKTGASWLIFTIGQNTSYYASPNATLDKLAGPGHCSTRDLVRELAKGVHEQGKRFIAYLPAEISAVKPLHGAFGWDPIDQSTFEKRYTQFVREYSERLGEYLDGWWFDGCYTWPEFPNDRRHWPLWVEAARAGRPERVVAFNDGSFLVGNTKPVTPLQDYLSGETGEIVDGKIALGGASKGFSHLPAGRFADGTKCQWHALVPIDCEWAHEKSGLMEPPRYSDHDLFSFVKSALKASGALTLNVGVYQSGQLGAATLAQLDRLELALS